MTPLPSIQILRALAALAVAYGHAGHDLMRISGGAGVPLQGLSGAGVDLFFAISGFVMVLSSQPLFGAAGGPGVFLRRRLARIVPLYWIATTLFLVAMALLPGAVNAAGAGVADVLRSYLFIPFLRHDTGLIQPLYSLGWTLNYEMFFYALFALALPWRLERGVALVTGALVLAVLGGAVFQPGAAPLRFWSDPVVLDFALGALAGLAYVRGWRIGQGAGLALVAGALAVFLAINQSDILPVGWMRLAGTGLPMAAVLAGIALMRTGPGAMRAPGVLIALGDASYALYLLHPMVIRPLSIGWSHAGWGAYGAFVVVALGASALVAMAVFRLFERPMTRMLQGRNRARRGGVNN